MNIIACWHRRFRWITLVVVLGAVTGCASDQEVTKPDNPAPPPGKDALIVD